MVYIEKRKIGNQIYAYLCKKERVEGKVKRTLNVYLGNVTKLKERFKDGNIVLTDVETRSFGYVAALWKMAELLNLTTIINEHTEKNRKQGLSVGDYITLAAINRADNPCSKNALGAWYQDTWLTDHLGISKETLSSQAYWNHFSYLTKEEICEIETALNLRLLEVFKIDLECLLYDPTNFHTFIQTPKKGDLPKRGRAKSGRHDLNLIAMSLIVTKEGKFPLMHDTYSGNVHDARHFKAFVPAFIERCKALEQECKDITVVFDKGNSSSENIRDVLDGGLNYVVSLRRSSFKHLLDIPESDFSEVTLDNGKRILVCEKEETVFDMPEQRVILTKNKHRERRAMYKLFKRLDYIVNELLELREKLNWHVWKRKKRVEEKVESILSRRAGKCLDVRITGSDDALSMDIELRGDELEKMREGYGRSFLTTNHPDWTPLEVIEAYRGQHVVESQFKEMKCADSIRLTPMYHWTDQSITVHVFICVLALLLKCVLRMILSKAGFSLSHAMIQKKLRRIQFVSGKMLGGTMIHRLSNLSGDSEKIADALSLPEYL